MSSAALDPSSHFIKHEVLSTSSQPLLNFLFQSPPVAVEADGDTLSFRQALRANATETQQAIPDESKELEAVLLELIKNGPGEKVAKKSVTIVGAGVSGLCAGYELKKAGFDVRIFEASSRVGGRVVTFRDPIFAPGLHGEGGAMRIPQDHYLLHAYLREFELDKQLFDFEMENKFIYLSGYKDGTRLTYGEFDKLLKNRDVNLLELFPGLKDNEKGKTCDQLFDEAVEPVKSTFWEAYKSRVSTASTTEKAEAEKIKAAYAAITQKYDKYTLRSYLTDIAGWSLDAINLYDLGNAHVVFENGFIESFKDAFLSSNSQGGQAGMKQLQDGMDTFPKAFISAARPKELSLIDNITFGARVVSLDSNSKEAGFGQSPVKVTYETNSGKKIVVDSDYLVLAIPYTSQRTISKSNTFAPLQEMAIRDVRYVEVTKVLLQYKTRWWEKIFSDSTRDPTNLDGGLVSDLPIRYTMFPKTKGNDQTKVSDRGVIMAAYTFEQDATILGALLPERRILLAAQNIDRIFPEAKSLDQLEVGTSQVFPADELTGGSAFCYFGPSQKTEYLTTMCAPDWGNRVFFAGEQASYTHGWIQGALEAGLRCVRQVYDAATKPQAQ